MKSTNTKPLLSAGWEVDAEGIQKLHKLESTWDSANKVSSVFKYPHAAKYKPNLIRAVIVHFWKRAWRAIDPIWYKGQNPSLTNQIYHGMVFECTFLH